MRYFANPTGSPAVHAAMRRGDLGMIATPMQGNAIPDGVEWCADNGCFGAGYPGDEVWLAWLADRAHIADRCAFAVAPDVVGDAEATLARSAPWLPRIRALGYPAALVAQDGLERLAVPWETFDVLFIGGSTAWKLGPHVARLVVEAKAHGKPVHMGRVNSAKRYNLARRLGCDSADGTILTFGPDENLRRVTSWTEGARLAPMLGEVISR